MGRPKLALPLGQFSVLEAVVGTVREGGVETALVVLGPNSEDLRLVAQKAGASVLALPSETAQMRQTIERGLDWLDEHCRPQPDDGWLLLPADHPCVDPSVVRALIHARRRESDKSIIVPSFGGRWGHPVWIAWQHVAALRRTTVDQGVNVYLRSQPAATLELAVASETILWDLDTPEDYERLQAWRG
jgi:molybdenum cofactor cytidylyltransferase